MNKQIITNFLSKLQNGIYFGLGLSLTIGIISFAYAAISYSSLGGQTSGGNLSATMWNKLYEHTVPVGFVGSFNLATCPTGWSEYTPARGRFIRGIDSTGTNDSVRIAGDIQEDAFQGHWHNMKFGNGTETTGLTFNGGAAGRNNSVAASAGTATSNNIQVNNPRSDGINGTPRIASETRPKNVALLFCQKD